MDLLRACRMYDSSQPHDVVAAGLTAVDSPPPTSQLQEQKQLQTALFTAQQSQEAWSIGGQLLSDANEGVNVRFFGAHTITIKIARDWQTLPEDHWLPLKEALLGWLSTSAPLAYPPASQQAKPGERIVLRKLASAVTGLSLRIAPKNWSDWLLETLMRLSASGCSRTGLYEVLTTVIEDVSRADLVGSRRVEYEQVISSVAPQVSETIRQSLTAAPQAEGDEVNSALRCLQGWIAKRDLNADLLSTLYPLVLPYLANEATCVAACACVEDILLDMSFSTRTRVSPILDFCASPQVGSILQRAQTDQDMDDISLALFKLLVATFEHSYTVIVEELQSSRSIILLQRLLMLTCFPGYHASDEQVSDLGLPIWAYVQEEVSDNGIVATESGFGDPRWTTVREVFEALVGGLRVKVEYPPDAEYQAWPKDIKQAFARYRVDAGDCLINSYYVLRNAMLGMLVAAANGQLPQDSSISGNYSQAEASLYCIAAVQEAVPEDEDTYLDKLFAGPMLSIFSPNSSPSFVRLQTTALRVIEVYAPWFKANSTQLVPAVQAAVAALKSPDTSRAAALAMSALCDACRRDLAPHVSSFAGLVRDLEGSIPTEDYVKVLGSVAAVIQALPAGELVGPVVVLVEEAISKLAAALSIPDAEESRTICLAQLAALAACAKALAEPEDEVLDLDGLAEATDEAAKAKSVTADPRVEQLRGYLLEGIRALSLGFPSDAEITQALSDLLKACTSTNISTPLSLDAAVLFELVSHLAARDLDPVWLSLAGLLLFRQAKAAARSHDDILRAGMERILSCGLTYLAGPAALVASPDIVQGFMDWSLSALTSFASVLCTLPRHLEGLLELTVNALELQERVGLQKAIQLLTAIVLEADEDRSPKTAPTFAPMVRKHGKRALRLALAGIGGRLPRSNLGFLADLLLAFARRLPNETRDWLKELFAEPEFPSSRPNRDQKLRYAKAIMSARSLRKLKEATETFAIVCRGLDGTAYATA